MSKNVLQQCPKIFCNFVQKVLAKNNPGVMLELSKGNMIFDIVVLINSGVITTADLEGFSDELRESVDFLLHR